MIEEDVLGSIKCIKDWTLNNKLIFKKNWNYPYIEEKINVDTRIKSLLVCNDEIRIWFHSGSEYFNIDFID